MSHSNWYSNIRRIAALTAERALEFLPSEPGSDLATAAPPWIRLLLDVCHWDLPPGSSADLDPVRVEQVRGAVEAVSRGSSEDWSHVVEGYVEQRGGSGDIDRWAASHPRRQQYAEETATNYKLYDEHEAIEAGRYDELWEVGHRVVRYLQTNVKSDVLPTDHPLLFRLLEDRDPNDSSAPLAALTYLDAIGESPGPERLVRVLAHPDPEVRKRAFFFAADLGLEVEPPDSVTHPLTL